MNDRPRVAFVDDDAELRNANQESLELAGFEVYPFADAESALAFLDADFPGVVVSDIRMPRIDGLELFQRLKALDADLPVILITGHGDVPMAVAALHDGAYDFIAKPYGADRLVQSVSRAAEKRRLVLENRRLRLAAQSAEESLPLIGQTPATGKPATHHPPHRRHRGGRADRPAKPAAARRSVASLLHEWSSRRSGNFVAVNCGALPESMIESELFGHEAGAFTGAQKKRIGRIEHSSGGTLFLDEIESMPPAAQVRLLRVLEQRTIEPLGSNESRELSLRVVAASKIDLGNPVQRGDFREDLYYRLNVVTVSIPPLRERKEDIPLLFAHFMQRAAARFGIEVPQLSPQVSRYLFQHDWPGNVRELAHFAERLALGLGDVIAPPATLRIESGHASLPARLEQYEADLIREALLANAGDVRSTLETLGIPRKTFYDKLQRHGIDRAQYVRKADD